MNRPPTFFFAILSLVVFLTISDYGMTNLEPLYVAQGYDLAVDLAGFDPAVTARFIEEEVCHRPQSAS